MGERGAPVTEEFLSTAGDGKKRYQMHNLDGAKDGMGRPTGSSLGQSVHPRHHNSEAIELARSRGEHVGVVDMQTGKVLIEAMPGDKHGDVFYRDFYHQEGAGHDDKAADRVGIREQGTQEAMADGGRRFTDQKHWNPQGKRTNESGGKRGEVKQEGGRTRAASGKEHVAEGDSAVKEVSSG